MEFVSTLENIWTAASDGDIERVSQLVREGASVNSQDEYGYSPLHAASSYGHIELVDLLVSAGAVIDIMDSDGDTPLLFCEEPAMFEKLLSVGANPSHRNSQGEGIFEKVVEDKNADLLRHLIARGFVAEEVGAAALARFEDEEDGDGMVLDMDRIREEAEAEDDEDDAEDIGEADAAMDRDDA